MVLYYTLFLRYETCPREHSEQSDEHLHCDSRWTEWLGLRYVRCWEVCFTTWWSCHVDNACPKLSGRCIPRKVCIREFSMMCVYLADHVPASVRSWYSVIPDRHRVSIVSGCYLVYAYRVTCRTINVKVEMILVTLSVMECGLGLNWLLISFLMYVTANNPSDGM